MKNPPEARPVVGILGGGPSFFLMGGHCFLSYGRVTLRAGGQPLEPARPGAVGRLARSWPLHGFSPWEFPQGNSDLHLKECAFFCTSGSFEQVFWDF